MKDFGIWLLETIGQNFNHNISQQPAHYHQLLYILIAHQKVPALQALNITSPFY